MRSRSTATGGEGGGAASARGAVATSTTGISATADPLVTNPIAPSATSTGTVTIERGIPAVTIRWEVCLWKRVVGKSRSRNVTDAGSDLTRVRSPFIRLDMLTRRQKQVLDFV